ncbi:SIMPL domain-containing protein [Brucella gallinifaecis]|uniref:SIMPL domain-containing protein n=1 Tax=Brucella gallinifaecis TaxID=215590 RepID=A0A502BSD6_9HYPH|nr:SIMPL domain-containing protein [Brucella gallinifaecis]TPF76591.1 SIMPL domain-containing protein [Brucella gallinifaecis]
MKKRATSLLVTSVSALLLAGALTLPSKAQENQMTRQPARITVTGEGKMTSAPDMAILNLTVLRDAETAREAMTANNEAMAKVLEAMKKAGVEERDLQTSGINIQPRYVYPDDKNGLKEPKISGYSVSNSLTVRVRDLAKVGNVLDESVTLGVNQGGDLSFVNDDPAATINEARKRAVADAIAKAKTLAEAADVDLGRVIEISEQNRGYMPVPIVRQAKMMAAAAPEDSVPVAAGENSYNVSVNVVFEIKE